MLQADPDLLQHMILGACPALGFHAQHPGQRELFRRLAELLGQLQRVGVLQPRFIGERLSLNRRRDRLLFTGPLNLSGPRPQTREGTRFSIEARIEEWVLAETFAPASP